MKSDYSRKIKNKVIYLGFIVFILSVFLFSSLFTKIARSSWGNMNNELVIDNVSNTSTGTSNASNIVLDNNDVPYIIWIDTSTGNSEVLLSKWTTGTGWTDMAGSLGYDNISNNAGTSSAAKLIFDNNNVPYVVWIDNTVTNYDIYISKYTSGTGWTNMAGSLGYDNIYDSTKNSYSPDIAIDSNNIPYVVWYEQIGSNLPDIHFKKYTPGTGWTKMDGTAGFDDLSNSSLTYNSSLPKIKISTANEPYVIFEESFAGVEDVYITKYTYGTGWTQMDNTTLGKEDVSNTAGLKQLWALELDSNNVPYVVWADNTTGNYEIFATKYTTGTGWTQMDETAGYDNVSNTSGGSLTPRFLINSFNVPYISWQDATTGNNDIYFSKYTDGTGWTQMDGTSGYDNVSGTASSATAANMAIGPNDDPHIVWQQSSGLYSEIYYRKWTAGTGWTKADYTIGTDNVSNNASASSTGPYIDIDNTNQAYIIWNESSEIYFSHWFYDAIDQVDLSASVDPTLSFMLSSTSCNLGTFSSSAVNTCSYISTISTNSSNGYIAYIEDTNSTGLASGSNEINGTVSGGATSTAVDAGSEEYGIGTNDADYASLDINQLETSCTSGASPVNGVAADNIKGTAQSYAISTAPVSSDQVTICHAVSITGTTPAGSYSQTVEITVVANY